MRVLKPRNRAALAVLASAVAAVFVLPASPASAVSVDNACRNNVTANNSQISVDTTGTVTPDPVLPDDTVTLSNLSQTANVPGAIFVAGYNLGLLTVGDNTIPATVSTFIEGTNTVEGVQQTNFAATSISTTISDPDTFPGTGDESATDGQFTVTYNDLTFTASGPAGSTIMFREDTRTPLSVATGAEVGGIIIRATIGGFLSVRFACSPGTVTPPDPGTVTFIDPAPSFGTTVIIVVDGHPTANAGPDQTVFAGDLVSLDGTASSDPAGQPLTYNWTQTGGPSVTLSDPTSTTPSFTAPAVPATLEFQLEVCDPDAICDTDTVAIIVLHADADAAGEVIVNGPVTSTKTSKSFVFKVSNLGTVPITVDPATDISSTVDVNGMPTGSVSPNSGTKTLSPGASTRVKLVWSYAAGSLVTGDSVVFNACLHVAGDIDTTNDCDSASAVAK